MVICQNFVRARDFTESFRESSPLRNPEGIWRVFQKLSGFIWRVECGEALGKYMESLKLCVESY